MAGSVLFVGAFLTILSNVGFIRGFGIQNSLVGCEPRRVVLPLDAPRHQYFPYIIDDIYRCSGGCGSLSPKFHHCMPKTQSNVTGEVVDLSTGSTIQISVVNHTSCECTCITTAEDCSENEDFVADTCSCQCKYTDQPETPCRERFSWNPFQCKCICAEPVRFCPVSKEWSHASCGCVCTQFAVESCKAEKKYLNTTTCNCEDAIVKNVGPGVTGKRTGDEVDWKLLFGVMIAELVVLIVLFDLYLYWRYEKGVFHWIHDKCCSHPRGSTRNAQASNAKPDASNGNPNHSPSLYADKRPATML